VNVYEFKIMIVQPKTQLTIGHFCQYIVNYGKNRVCVASTYEEILKKDKINLINVRVSLTHALKMNIGQKNAKNNSKSNLSCSNFSFGIIPQILAANL
jgi:hypothetical protein